MVNALLSHIDAKLARETANLSTCNEDWLLFIAFLTDAHDIIFVKSKPPNPNAGRK